MSYEYTVKTDAAEQQIEAASIDEAAAIFASDEWPHAHITDADSLFAQIERIGDGAWCWIESQDAPDGERRSVGC